jgi:hypothetical protein
MLFFPLYSLQLGNKVAHYFDIMQIIISISKTLNKKLIHRKEFCDLLIVIYCISVVDSILPTQEFLTASANARAFNILKWIKCD